MTTPEREQEDPVGDTPADEDRPEGESNADRAKEREREMEESGEELPG